jgi:formylglycine-generating enzyme required for sulfatase activity
MAKKASKRAKSAQTGAKSQSQPTVTPGWRWVEAQVEEELRRRAKSNLVTRDLPDWLAVDLPNRGGPLYLRRIPAGTFWMGARGNHRENDWDKNQEPIHRVEITRDFYLGAFPVTQQQFRAFTEATGVTHENGFSGGSLLPAENMDWHQAAAYSQWLTQSGCLGSMELPEQSYFALPTEAQWEYACKGPAALESVDTEFWNGDGTEALSAVGWYAGNSANRTHPVGDFDVIKRPGLLHPRGLFDLHGNVDEWCCDNWEEVAFAYRARRDGVQNPGGSEQKLLFGPKSADGKEQPARADASSASRVVRGGSWLYVPWGCRSANRSGREPWLRLRYLGFRLCLLPGPGALPSGEAHPKTRAEGRSGGARGGLKPPEAPPHSPGAAQPPEPDFETLTGPPRPRQRR